MAADDDFLGVFFYEGKAGSAPAGLEDGIYSYRRSEGESWLEEIVRDWPHDGNLPTYRRRSAGAVLDDIAGLQPLVSLNRRPDPVGYVPDGMIAIRPVIEEDPDFVTEEELRLSGDA